MAQITIYGKDGCESCANARVVLMDAEYKHFNELHDDYPPAESHVLVTATKGNLPIIVVETENGRLVLGVADAALGSCAGGSCKIGGTE